MRTTTPATAPALTPSGAFAMRSRICSISLAFRGPGGRRGVVAAGGDGELVLGRLLLCGDVLHFADDLVELGDLVGGPLQLLLPPLEIALESVGPEKVADDPTDDEDAEEDELLLASLLLLRPFDGQ